MKRNPPLMISLCILLMSGMGCETKEISPTRGKLPYKAFPDTYTLTNGKVVVVVAPRVGRVIGYHRVGEPNRLWIDTAPTLESQALTGIEWANYGGDKVWLAPQGLWKDILGRWWPPETTTDGDPMTVRHVDPRQLVMVSAISPAHGARLTRTITLPDDETTVRIHHRLERVMDDPYPVQIWTITQIPLPRAAYLDLAEDRPCGKGVLSAWVDGLVWKEDYRLGVAHYTWSQSKQSKVGTYGRWVAAEYAGTIFAQYAPLDLEAEYYDQANCEMYVNPDLQYMELELLSPTTYLPKGRAIEFTVTCRTPAR